MVRGTQQEATDAGVEEEGKGGGIQTHPAEAVASLKSPP